VLLATALIAVPSGPARADAALIDFEGTVFQPNAITSQFCNDPTSNVGVEFLQTVRLVEPLVGTYTPTHAATNDFGVEFSELDVMEIGFTAPQSFVSIRVGLDRSYLFPVTAHLRAFTTATPGGTPVFTDSIALGQEATSIVHQLYVSSDGGATAIRSIEIEFTGPSPGNGAFEVVDNLLFPTSGPLCVTDTTPPTVQITEPALGTPGYAPPGGGPAQMGLAFVAEDLESGIASVEVEFLDGGGNLLGEFDVCGGPSVPACEPGTQIARDLWTWAPAGTEMIYVYAFNPSGQMGYHFAFVTVAPSTVNVWAMGLEITQATQPWVATATASRKEGAAPWFTYPATPTSVPLVEGRTTVARLFVGVEGLAGGATELAGIGGELRCGLDPGLVIPCPGPSVVYPTDDPVRGVSEEITVRTTDSLISQRRDAARSLNFVLPDEWTTGALHLEAQVTSPVPQCAGCADGADAIRIVSVPFRPVPPWNLSVVQVLVERNGTLTATKTQRDDAVQYIRATYPIDDTTIPGAWRHYPYLVLLFPGMNPDTSELLDDLESSYSHMLEDYGYEAVWAITDSTSPGWQSLGRLNGYASSNGGSYTSGAHEVGHALGLLHSGNPPGHGDECKPESFCDKDWPWDDGGIGAFGFDVFEFDVKDPGNPPDPGHYNDLMSYGHPEWVSPRTWIRVFNQLADMAFPYPKASPESTASLPLTVASDMEDGTAVEQLLIRADFDAEAGWTIDPVYEVLRPQTAAPPETGDYLIRVLDGDGGVLAERWVEAPLLHIDTDDPGVMPIPDPSFMETVPMTGAAATITLSDGEAVLASMSRSAHAPAVSLIEPPDGVFDGTIRWEWGDADGDDLVAIVEYLPGGEREPLPLAIDYVDDVLIVDPALLPGSADARILLRVTDGFTTTTVRSAPFTVADKAPDVEIIEPSSFRVIGAGDRLTLRGTAMDPEDGLLGGSSLTWTSDRDGVLGTGDTIGVGSLGTGIHVITLEAVDTAGNTGAADVAVIVVVPPERNGQPIAHAGDDVVVGEASAVTLDGSASVDLDGDPLTFRWRIVDGPGGGLLDGATTAHPELLVQEPGDYIVELVVHDGEIGSLPDQVVVTLDGTPPEIDLVFPPETGVVVVGTVDLIAAVLDTDTEVTTVAMSIREDDGATGTPIGLEDLPAAPDADDTWRYGFDSSAVPDGPYVLWIEAADTFGNAATSGPHGFVVHNWVVTPLPPIDGEMRAGRTVPVKFSLTTNPLVDPGISFVTRADLLIRIRSGDVVIHEAMYGDTAGDYRIDDLAGTYITNFKTDRSPAVYTVEVTRNGTLLGEFTIQTIR
jgi:hypothetical protein